MATYKIVEELGRGGMGVVYRALHPALNREVAIKFLIGDPGTIAGVTHSRFKREMDVLMRLSHPSIIKVYDAGETDGRLYYVMELLRARDLHWHLKRRGKLPIAVVIAVLDQLLDALDYIHGRDLVHRDIKPSNIALEDSGRAILMDFGVVHQDGVTLLTQEGHAVGTPRYFSPEMIQRGECSPQSDQFSLGVVAYELLTASPPFEGNTLPEIAYAIMKEVPPPIEKRRPDVPPGVAPVVMRMMAKDPAARWPTAGAAREALQEAIGAWEEAPEPLLQSQIVPLPPAPPALRPTGRRAIPVEPRMLVTQGAVETGFGADGDAGQRRVRHLIALVVGGLIAVAVPVARLVGPRASPGITTIAGTGAVPRSSEVSVVRIALDRVRVSFRTGTASRWSLDRGHGVEAAETADATAHELDLTCSPWEGDESLALVSGPQRVELAPPPALSELVHRLRAATRTRELGPAAVEKLWMAMRSDLIKLTKKISPKTFRAVLGSAPEARRRFDEMMADARRTRNLGETLKALEPHVAQLLASKDTPDALRTELLEALWAVDRLDAMASWFALPAPFGVQKMMAPAMEIDAAFNGELPGTRGKRTPLALEPDVHGVVLVLAKEVPDEKNPLNKLGDVMLAFKEQLRGRKYAFTGSFTNLDLPPAPARRFLIEVEALDPNIWLLVKPPGFETPLPVRVPDTLCPAPDEKVWLTLTLRGALAGVRGSYQFSQERAFEEQSRIYVLVDRVIEEEL